MTTKLNYQPSTTRPKFFWAVCASLVFSVITCPWFSFTVLVHTGLVRELFGPKETTQIIATGSIVAIASIITILVALYRWTSRRQLPYGRLILINMCVNLSSVLWCALAWETMNFWNSLQMG